MKAHERVVLFWPCVWVFVFRSLRWQSCLLPLTRDLDLSLWWALFLSQHLGSSQRGSGNWDLIQILHSSEIWLIQVHDILPDILRTLRAWGGLDILLRDRFELSSCFLCCRYYRGFFQHLWYFHKCHMLTYFLWYFLYFLWILWGSFHLLRA